MNLVVDKEELLRSIVVITKGLSSRSTIPILSGVRIEASADGQVTLSTTDLEISVRSVIQSRVSEPGVVVVPGRLFSEIIKSFPSASVSLVVENNSLQIKCERSLFTLSTLQSEEFPKFPVLDISQKILIPRLVILESLQEVNKAISRDETRPILTGIYMTITDSKLTMVATDSYRLAVSSVMLENNNENLEVIIPGKIFEDVVKSTTGDMLSIAITDNQIIMDVAKDTFITRRIEGTFPNYKQLIPTDFQTTLKVKKKDLLEAVKRVAILTQHNTSIRLMVSTEDNKLTLISTSQDIGNAKEEVFAEVSGVDVEMAYNHNYLLDGINASIGDTINLNVVSPLKPGLIRSEDRDGYMYVIMPVRIN